MEKAKNSSAWEVADLADGFCGALSGLRVTPSERAGGVSQVADLSNGSATPLISAGSEAMFFRFDWGGIPIFVSLAEQVIDLDDELDTPNFDIRDHFFSATPIVLYLRWAFPKSAWRSPEAGACLVIDDPLLKPRYGLVCFRSLLTVMERHNFSTSIAFIPWNWRRSDPKTVRLFKENPDRFSLSIHGCDHTAAEFRADDANEIRSLITTAVQRMAAHEKRTGLVHDRIMVFPQGVFSETAIRELKQANFLAAVNTEVVASGEGGSRRITIADVWDVAVRSYADFPIYTRRYPHQGIENFAFDTLLGKPCLIVIHHDFCAGDYVQLAELVERLNALKTQLVWRNLEGVVKRSYRQRESDPASQEIEMYGREMLVENRSPRSKLFRVKCRESQPAAVAEIHVGPDPVLWDVDGQYLRFEVTLPPGESALLSVRHARINGADRKRRIHSALKTGLRRYLSEFRDNYAVPAKARFAAFSHPS